MRKRRARLQGMEGSDTSEVKDSKGEIRRPNRF